MYPGNPQGPDGGDQPYGGEPYGGSPYGGQPYGDSPYGGDQPYPGQPYGAGPSPWYSDVVPPPPERPTEILRSFQLWLVSIGIVVVSMLITAFLPGQFADQQAQLLADEMTAAGMQMNAAEASDLLSMTLVITVVLTLPFLALHAFFVFRMRDGRNWARITMTVIAAFVLPFTLLAVLQGAAPLTTLLLNIVYLLVTGAAIYFMWTRPAGEYLRAHTFYRQHP